MREFRLYTYIVSELRSSEDDKIVLSFGDYYNPNINKAYLNPTGRWKIVEYDNYSFLYIESKYTVKNKKLTYDRRFMSFLYEDKYEYSDKEIKIWIDADQINEEIVPIEHPIQECIV